MLMMSGEISYALEKVWGRHVASSQVVQGAYAAKTSSSSSDAEGMAEWEREFQEVRRQVKLFEEKTGRRPRILVAKMGQDGHDRGAKVISSGFSDMGE